MIEPLSLGTGAAARPLRSKKKGGWTWFDPSARLVRIIWKDKAARILSFFTPSDFASRLVMSDSRNELLFGNRGS